MMVKVWSLLLLTACHALAVAVFARTAVSATAWWLLFGTSVGVALGLWRPHACAPGVQPSATMALAASNAALAWAAYAALLAAMFYGADAGLDILNGAQRNKAQVAAHLGGLEIWFVLCPGAVSVALATAAQRWLVWRRRKRT